jgi:HEAT repeat protein
MQSLHTLLIELQSISPMPGDEELEAVPEEGFDRLDRYVALLMTIRQAVQDEYPPEVIPTLLSSFGIGDAYEVYWTALHLIESFPDKQALARLIQQASQSPNPGTRKWCCHLMGRRRSLDDLPFLLERVNDEVTIVRIWAMEYGLSMLAQVHALPEAIPVLTALLNDEQASVRQCAQKVISTLQK